MSDTPRSEDAKPIDRLLIAAVVDRLIYGSDTTFQAEDARRLLDVLPRKRVPWLEIGAKGHVSGGSAQGFAPGVGNVRVDDDRKRKFDVSTAADAYVRAGQWKLLCIPRRRGALVEIEQIMADPLDEGRGARLRYSPVGVPEAMDIRVVHSIRLLFSWLIVQVPGWRPWKTPT
jgi:hypothetical protein